MIRSPVPQDLVLIQRLQGLVLAPDEALVSAYSPLRVALLSSLNPLRPGFCQAMTYVLGQSRAQKLRGFVQVQENHRRAIARVVYLAPDGRWDNPAVWPGWLEDLCRRLGERGMKRLLACLPVDDSHLPAFQRAAFHIYAHEDLFRLQSSPTVARSDQGPGVRPRRAADAWGLARLYNAVTPPLVQQAEGLSQAGHDEAICAPVAPRPTRGHVLEIEQEILGYAELRRGSRGAWLRFLLHPQAWDMAETLVRGALSRLANQQVYCGVPDHQAGVRSALQSVGFEPFARQSLLVRYIAVFARRSVAELVGAVENRAKVAAPVARANGVCGIEP